MGFTKAPMLLAAAALRSGSTATCGVPGTFSYPYKGVDKRAAVSLLSIAAPPHSRSRRHLSHLCQPPSPHRRRSRRRPSRTSAAVSPLSDALAAAPSRRPSSVLAASALFALALALVAILVAA